MTKKVYQIALFILIIGSLVFAGCSNQAEETTPVEGETAITESGDAPTRSGNQGELPVQMQLAAGTLKLEETEFAVTAEQAAELLPLWKAARSLSESDNITSAEINAIYDQIEETMTADQIGAIEEMELSFEDLRDVFPEMGQFGGGQFGDVDVETMQATREAMRESGQMPEGFTPGQGGGPQGGFPEGGPPEGFGNNNSENEGSARNASLNSAIYDPVIELLESKLE